MFREFVVFGRIDIYGVDLNEIYNLELSLGEFCFVELNFRSICSVYVIDFSVIFYVG